MHNCYKEYDDCPDNYRECEEHCGRKLTLISISGGDGRVKAMFAWLPYNKETGKSFMPGNWLGDVFGLQRGEAYCKG
jgi:hypothetical protein